MSGSLRISSWNRRQKRRDALAVTNIAPPFALSGGNGYSSTGFSSYANPELPFAKSHNTRDADDRLGRIFAAIQTNEVVWIRSGHIVTKDEALRLDLEIGDFSVQIHDDFFLCPRSADEVHDFAIRFNHSCEPNVGVWGQVVFVAMRHIAAGEHLTVDYATIIAHEYHLKCSCGAIACREVVTGNDWKNDDIQRRYNGFFSRFIQDKIDKSRG